MTAGAALLAIAKAGNDGVELDLLNLLYLPLWLATSSWLFVGFLFLRLTAAVPS